ncbi:MAG: heat-inducible transcriptional repressor HrcA [Alphaproteobacteria bacterium]
MDLINKRSLEILNHIVEAYVETGEPIGSLALAERLGMNVSSATIRNVMARLEEVGLLYSPHTSAGRLPTEAGLRFFVQGLLETGVLSNEDRLMIQSQCVQKGLTVDEVLGQVTSILSGLSSCASFLISPKKELTLKHIEFVSLQPGKALAILVTNDDEVENRLIDVPKGIPPSALAEASNYLNHRLVGKTLTDAKQQILKELSSHQTQLDQLSQNVIEKGLALWSGKEKNPSLIIQGQSKLLHNVAHLEELEAIKNIFGMLEQKETLVHLLDASLQGDGVQIFIGAQNEWFSYGGCSLVLSPYGNSEGKIIGAVGVIGPTRINYGRIIPMVDYTAKIVSHLLKR